VGESADVVRRFYDAFNADDVDAAAAQYAEVCEWSFPALGSTCSTREEVAEVCRNWRAAFPDGRVEVTNLIATGNFVVVEWDSHGTWTGPMDGDEEPNGKRFRRRGCAVHEVEAGSIIVCRDYFDRANMYGPLGLLHRITE
jgi:steroid delta-isomerase-like uncharacterized protein